VGDLVGAQGASPLILGKTRNKTQKEEKPAGQEKKNPPSPHPLTSRSGADTESEMNEGIGRL